MKKKIIPGWPTSSLDWPIVHSTLEIIIQTLKQTLYNFLIVLTGIALLFLNMKSSHVLTYFVLTESISKEIQNSLYFIFVLKQHSIFLLMALTTLGMQYYAFFFFYIKDNFIMSEFVLTNLGLENINLSIPFWVF